MKKLKKVFLIVGLVVLVLILVVGLAVGFFLDGIVKTGIETVGPKVTQVPISVDAVKISLLGGSAQFKGLVVGMPQGYQGSNTFSVGLASVSLEPKSLLSDKIVVKDVTVDAPEITFEGGLSDNNLTQIQKNVNDFVASLTGGASTNAPAEAAGAPAKPGKKLQVNHFIITNARVHGSVRLFGSTSLPLPSLPLPAIELNDLGTGTNGITPSELVGKVMSAVTTSSLKAVGTAAKDLGKGAVNAVEGAGKSLGGAAGSLGKSLGGLFGK